VRGWILLVVLSSTAVFETHEDRRQPGERELKRGDELSSSINILAYELLG